MGVDGKPLITLEVYQETKSTKEAKKIFLLHLLTTGTVAMESLCVFGKVLQQTSDDYTIHEDVLEKLKEDFMHPLTYFYMYTNISLVFCISYITYICVCNIYFKTF